MTSKNTLLGPKIAQEALKSPEKVIEMTEEAIEERMHLLRVGDGELTTQQQRFVMLVCSGMSSNAAAKAVGVKAGSRSDFIYNPKLQDAIRKYRAEQVRAVNFGIEEAHALYMDAHSNAADATEQKNVVDSLVKLHGISKESNNKAPTNQVNIQINATAEQMKGMSDEELLKLVGQSEDRLDPKASKEDTIEGTIVDEQ